MLKILANIVITLFVIWTITVSVCEFSGITIHFPWVISSAEEIPINRLQTLRIAILLTFAHYGVLHIFGQNQQYLPIHFLIQFLFYLVLAGGIILFKSDVLMKELIIWLVFAVVWFLCKLAAQPLNRNYFRNKWLHCHNGELMRESSINAQDIPFHIRGLIKWLTHTHLSSNDMEWC